MSFVINEFSGLPFSTSAATGTGALPASGRAVVRPVYRWLRNVPHAHHRQRHCNKLKPSSGPED